MSLDAAVIIAIAGVCAFGVSDSVRTRRELRLLRAAIEAQRKDPTDMTKKLGDIVAQLTADDAALEAEVDALIKEVQSVPQLVADAVTKALADAGVADDAAAATLETLDAQIKAKTAAALAVLAPAPAADPAAGDQGAGGASDASALSVSPASVTFEAGVAGSQAVTISGGVAPYSVSDLPTGVSYDGTNLVADGTTTAGAMVATVTDSAEPPETASLSVDIQ